MELTSTAASAVSIKRLQDQQRLATDALQRDAQQQQDTASLVTPGAGAGNRSAAPFNPGLVTATRGQRPMIIHTRRSSSAA
ncbi:hypothetical protein WCLP8_820004 [uncultured Gammaproteobacteria bacterium]